MGSLIKEVADSLRGRLDAETMKNEVKFFMIAKALVPWGITLDRLSSPLPGQRVCVQVEGVAGWVGVLYIDTDANVFIEDFLPPGNEIQKVYAPH